MATLIPAPVRHRLTSSDPVLVVVCLAIASTQMAWAVVVPVLPAYVEGFGAGATELGLVVAMFGVGRLVMNVPAGLLSEHFDRRKLLLLGVAGVVVFQVATAFAPSLQALYALRFGTGLAGGLAITSGMALVADLTPAEGRGRAMAMLQGFQLFGGSLGPTIGGAVATVWGTRAPFLVCGSAALAVLVFGRRRLLDVELPDEDLDEAQPAGEDTGDRNGNSPSLLRDRSFLAICAVGFATFFNRFGGTQSLVPVIAYTIVGMSIGQLGAVLGVVTLCNLVTITIAGGLSDRVGRKPVIVAGLLAIAVGLPIYAVTDSVGWFVLATVITGVANGFSGPTPAAYVADVAPRRKRGTAIGIYRTFGDLAGVIGPVSLGWLIDNRGTDDAVWSLAALMLATAIGFAFASRETVGPRAPRRRTTPEASTESAA